MRTLAMVTVLSLAACSEPPREAAPTRAPPAAIVAPDTGIFFEFQVDRKVDLDPTVKDDQPVYPTSLKAAGITGRVVAQFVVDTLGKPEPSSFKITETAHRYFSDAVLVAMPRMRFLPAELHGHRVRQLTTRAFDFSINP